MSILQQPLASGFGAASTTEDVIRDIDLSGKTAIVTGGYSGLGLEAARTLRSAGAKVIVPTRDTKKAATALAGINVEIEPMDLLDPDSINAFARRFLATGQPLHLLVNSAGIMAVPERTLDARGFELQFATNHLGHFQLAARLWPALVKAQGARVVSVSSWGHHFSPVVFDDPNFEHRAYDPWKGYGQSKTANVLFAVELDRRGQQDGVRAFSLHPGSIVATGLGKYLSADQLRQAGAIDEQGKAIYDPSTNRKTVQQGAATIVWCAASPQLDGMGGVYCENCDIAPMSTAQEVADLRSGGSMIHRGVMPYAVDPASAERLWKLSEQMLSKNS